MNLRHAAALALVGWYLMVPLPGNDPIPNAGVRSFLKWIHLQSFDSAAECEDGLDCPRMVVCRPLPCLLTQCR
jgi:hypothetical protein